MAVGRLGPDETQGMFVVDENILLRNMASRLCSRQRLSGFAIANSPTAGPQASGLISRSENYNQSHPVSSSSKAQTMLHLLHPGFTARDVQVVCIWKGKMKQVQNDSSG